MDKNKQFIEEKYLDNLNQSRMAAPKRMPESKTNEMPMDIAAPQTTPYKRENEEKYLDNWNQARANQPQVIPMPEKPKVSFPFFALSVAVINDGLDIILEIVELVGVPATAGAATAAAGGIEIAFNMLVGGIRMLGRAMRPGMPNIGLAAVITILELIPGVGIIPFFTMEVIVTYVTDIKSAKQSYEQAVTATRMQIASLSADIE